MMIGLILMDSPSSPAAQELPPRGKPLFMGEAFVSLPPRGKVAWAFAPKTDEGLCGKPTLPLTDEGQGSPLQANDFSEMLPF